jgi:hypothetical protein
MRARFEINSDSGHKYRIKKIGENDTTTQNWGRTYWWSIRTV